MLGIQYTSQFKKDYKRAQKRGRDLAKLKAVLEALRAEETLEAKHRDHSLSGQYAGFRECHIEPDWLLVYEVNRDELVLVATRTGSHSDLFNK